jgi:hypothetical protein
MFGDADRITISDLGDGAAVVDRHLKVGVIGVTPRLPTDWAEQRKLFGFR